MRERTALKEALRAGNKQQSLRKDAQKASFSEFQKPEEIYVHGGKCSEFWGESETWNERPPKGISLKKNQWITETRAVAKKLITSCSFSPRDEKTSHEEFQIKSLDNREIRAETSSNSRHSVFTHLYAQPSFKHTATR